MKLDTIICGDNASVLSEFEDECIDLTVTSPPYDNLRTYNGFTFEFETVADQLYRVTKAGGVVVWVVGDAVINGSESGTSFRQALTFMQCGFNLHDTMIYMKDSCPVYNPRNKRYKSMFEFMFVFSKGTPNTYNELKDKPTKRARIVSGATHRQPNGTKRKFRDIEIGDFQARGNIWLYAIGNGKVATDKISNEHPARFPESLARDHILSWSNEGDIVLDPFCGSGTTCKMAKENGRHWIGIDISDEYCKLSERRINGANVPLFTMEAK